MLLVTLSGGLLPAAERSTSVFAPVSMATEETPRPFQTRARSHTNILMTIMVLEVF